MKSIWKQCRLFHTETDTHNASLFRSVESKSLWWSGPATRRADAASHALLGAEQSRTEERRSEMESYGAYVSARETDRRDPRPCISLALTQTP